VSRYTLLPSLLIALLGLSITQPVFAADTPPLFEQTLPNGLQIICRQETATPLVSLQVFVKTGVAQEDPLRPGLGNFVAHTLLASTSNQVPEIMQQQIGSLGGNVSATWQPDYTQVSALIVKDQFRDAVALLSDVLENADFDPDVVESTRQDIIADIGTNSASIFQQDYDGIRQTLYADSPYALPPNGTVTSLNRLTRADLQRYFNRYYVPKNIVIVVVGNIDPDTAARDIVTDFGDFPTQGRGGRRPDLPMPPLPFPTTDSTPVHTAVPDLAEVGVMVGYRVPSIGDADYPAVLVANALLGGMKTSRLFTNLREKQGLAYELGSVVNTQQAASDVTAYAFAAPTRTDTVTKKDVPAVGFIKDQLLRQIAAFQAAPPTEAELIRAKHFLIGSYKIKHERLEDRTTLLGIAALESPQGTHFDTDYAHYINAVTAADVQRVAAKYFIHPAISVVEPDPQNGVVME
jgi:zinc protease